MTKNQWKKADLKRGKSGLLGVLFKKYFPKFCARNHAYTRYVSNIFWHFDELLRSLSLRKINRGDRRNAGCLHLCDWRCSGRSQGRQGSDTVFFCWGALFIIYL